MAAMALSGCQNNGDIGSMFGIWRVDAYMVDGTRVESPVINNTTVCFQGNVVEFVAVYDDYQSAYECYGTWAETATQFTFDFTHYDNDRLPGTDLYVAPAWLGMTTKAPMVMDITKKTGRELVLEWHDTAKGTTKTYKLKKTC